MSRNVENTRLWLVFSTSPSCSQMPVVFYHSVIHGLGFLFVEYMSLGFHAGALSNRLDFRRLLDYICVSGEGQTAAGNRT